MRDTDKIHVNKLLFCFLLLICLSLQKSQARTQKDREKIIFLFIPSAQVLFLGYNLMHFLYKNIPVKHYHKQDIEHHPQCLPCILLYSFLPDSPYTSPIVGQKLICLLSLQINLQSLAFYINRIIQYVHFLCLVSFIQQNYFEIYPYCCMYQKLIPFC